MDRRDFLKNVAITAAALAVTAKLPGGKLLSAEADPKAIPDLVAVRDGDPVAMFRKGMEAMGGMGAFVKAGKSVVIKPNIGWAQAPEMAANTNPELVGEIVRQCLAAGAKSVCVFDHTCNSWKDCYKKSGIEEAVTKAGGKVFPGNSEDDYIDVERPAAKKMKKAKIHKLIMESDVFINVPVLKHHGGAQMSCAMKNLMGLVWDRGYMHKNDLHQSIADSVLYRVPDLNVIDAFRIMVTNGPRGTTLNDVKNPKYMIISKDIVAADTAAAKVIDFKVESVPHLKFGQELGYGTMDLTKLNIKRLKV